MTCVAARGLSVDLQTLHNEASMAYKEAITFKWNAKFKLVPLDIHRQNRAERTIRTFKDHFLAILAGVALHFHCTFGNFFYQRLNSPSIFSVRPRSIQGLVGGNFSKVPSTSKRLHLVRWVIATSCNLGISTQNQVSILALDSCRYFKLVKTNTKSQASRILSNFAICTSPSLCLPRKIISITAYRSSRVQSKAHHLQQVTPNSKLLLRFKKSLSHGACLLPHPYNQLQG
jgi:hypothetical protein